MAAKLIKSILIEEVMTAIQQSVMPTHLADAVRSCVLLAAAACDGRKCVALGVLKRDITYWKYFVSLQISPSLPPHPLLVIRLAEKPLVRAFESYGDDFSPILLTVKLEPGESAASFAYDLKGVYEACGHMWNCLAVQEVGRKKGKSKDGPTKQPTQNRHVHALIAWPRSQARTRAVRRLYKALVDHFAPRNEEVRRDRCPKVAPGAFLRYSVGQSVNISDKQIVDWHKNADQRGLAKILEYLEKERVLHPDLPLYMNEGLYDAALVEYTAAIEQAKEMALATGIYPASEPDVVYIGSPEEAALFNADAAYLVDRTKSLIDDANKGRREAVRLGIDWWRDFRNVRPLPASHSV